MADVHRRLVWRHLRCGPTSYVRHLRGGRVAHEGVGLSFWYRALTAAISEVPVGDRELPLGFHARTADFQDVSVQGTLTYRITDPETAARRLDFDIDPDRGTWRSAPLEQLGVLLTETAQQYGIAEIARLGLRDAVTEGVDRTRRAVSAGLTDDERLTETGTQVIGVRVVAIRPEAEVERALRTPERERIQQLADKATYERRATAVEQERAIAENELHNQIELAAREEQLVTQRGRNERRRAEEAAEAERVTAEAKAVRDRLAAQVRAEARRVLGQAQADAEAARMAVYTDADPRVLLALAAESMADKLPQIGQLNISPDTLTTALGRLAGPQERR